MKEKTVRCLLWAGTIVMIGFSVWVLWVTGFFEAAGSRQGLEDYIGRCAPWSQAVFFAIQLSSVILAPIPSNLTAAAGGWLFGLWVSFLLTWGAVTAGSLIVFALARGLGRDFVQRVAGDKLPGRYLDALRDRRDLFLAIAFLFPLFPDDLLCILAGLTDISFRRFALLVLVGRPWGLLMSCAVGSCVLSIPWWGMALSGLAGLVLAVLALKFGGRLEETLLARLGREEPEES